MSEDKRSQPKITYRQREGVTPEQAREARARAYAFIFECYAKKEAEKKKPPSGASEAREERE